MSPAPPARRPRAPRLRRPGDGRRRFALAFLLAPLLAAVFPRGAATLPNAASREDIFGEWRPAAAARVENRDLAFDNRWTPGLRNTSLFLTGRSDDGWTVTIGFFGWTYKLFKGWGLYALVAEPDGTPHYYPVAVDRKDVHLGRDRLDIRAGAARIEGDREGTRVRLAIGGFECDLTFRNLLPPWRPGDGLARIAAREDVTMRLTVPIPWGEVRGTMRVDGRVVEVRGDGYSDMSVMSSEPDRTNSPITCLRGWSPAALPAGERWLISVAEYVSHPAYGPRRMPVLLLARGGRWVLTARDFTLEPLESARVEGIPYPYPRRLALRAETGGYRLEGEIVYGEPYLVNDLLADLPPVARAVVRSFTERSVIFRLSGEFRGTLRSPDGTKIPLRLAGPGEYLASR